VDAAFVKLTAVPTTSSCSEPLSFAELLQAVSDFLGDDRYRVLIQHARDPLGISQTEEQSGPRQIRIASSAIKNLE